MRGMLPYLEGFHFILAAFIQKHHLNEIHKDAR